VGVSVRGRVRRPVRSGSRARGCCRVPFLFHSSLSVSATLFFSFPPPPLPLPGRPPDFTTAKEDPRRPRYRGCGVPPSYDRLPSLSRRGEGLSQTTPRRQRQPHPTRPQGRQRKAQARGGGALVLVVLVLDLLVLDLLVLDLLVLSLSLANRQRLPILRPIIFCGWDV
jgi:hypothetical protein